MTDRSFTPAMAASDGEQPAPARVHSTRWRELRAAAAPLVLALLIFVLSRAAVAEYQVEGTSMSPTVHSGQYILVDALSYRFHQPQRGDVVVFRFPLDTTQNFIKRVIGVPGDVVEVRAGTVLVDSHAVREPYVRLPADYSWPAHRVPAGSVVVLGDNRVVSYDSHAWTDTRGQERPYLADGLILGRAVVAYWPPSQLAFLAGPSGAVAAGR